MKVRARVPPPSFASDSFGQESERTYYIKIEIFLGNLKEKKIGVLMGGLSTEREVSISTGNSVCEAMMRIGLNHLIQRLNRHPCNGLVYPRFINIKTCDYFKSMR